MRRRPAFWGLLIIGFGVAWLLSNLGIVDLDPGRIIATLWPLVLVAWGLDALLAGYGPGRMRGSALTGLVLLGIGLLFLGRNLGLYTFDASLVWKILWPLVLILIGWGIVRGGRLATSGGTHWAVMSGLEYTNPGWKLESGNFTAVMGGVKLDLSVAEIPPGEHVLSLNAVMGGIDISVPKDMEVECEGTAVLGGVKFFKDEAGGIVASQKTVRRGKDGADTRIVIHANALMGGVEIKNA